MEGSAPRRIDLGHAPVRSSCRSCPLRAGRRGAMRAMRATVERISVLSASLSWLLVSLNMLVASPAAADAVDPSGDTSTGGVLDGARGRLRRASHAKWSPEAPLGAAPPGKPARAGRCVSQIAAGGSAACARRQPWCWGSNPPGAHGTAQDPQDTEGLPPLPLSLLAGNAIELSMEHNIACVRTSRGAGDCAGGTLDASDAAYGEQGGHPVRIQRLEGATELYGTQCARVTDGVLESARPSATHRRPRRYPMGGVRSGDGPGGHGGGFACALRRDGTLWCVWWRVTRRRVPGRRMARSGASETC
ncbi:hypothetical protein STIAU_2639 [Stigmatella aurantiaca DW4/3-1]|uniref:Uncharacterized protein n=1 Tax=Stigmatella aurantiaca (strain DW4/3-1) TaxID=378806 RepID=Q094G3_STIAD|nr:hypothetical protein STIAU_2639 [Stigmatella aurantiaca DW4/3-1]